MNNKKEKIIGCSFDGLKDRYFVCGENASRGKDFFLADVLLPATPGGRFLVGEEAERSRVCSGYSWPPESQLNTNKPLRRVPVPWAWRLLIDSADNFARWKTTTGGSFELAKILAVHIANNLKIIKDDVKESILAIPEQLDEFGQDQLLRNLGSVNIKNVKLLWRNVAAALAWLDKVQDDFPSACCKDDFIIVVHLGPDSLEFTKLKLRVKFKKEKRFIIPLRESSKECYPLCGCDLMIDLIQQLFNVKEEDATWQIFTSFPESWELLVKHKMNTENLPRVWTRQSEWGLWSPEEVNTEKLLSMKATTSEFLKNITKSSFNYRRKKTEVDTWQKVFRECTLKCLNATTSGKLRGVILSGPLFSTCPGTWISNVADVFSTYGFSSKITKEAQIDTIWNPSFSEDIVAEGASIYGKRLSLSQPTYLDTLKQLSTLANNRGQLQWIPLLDVTALEILGGETHENLIGKSFSLDRNDKELEVYLRKGNLDVFKKAEFLFPYAPTEDTLLDTKIRVASANGLAQVELIPEKKEFLGGHRVFLDYSRMKETRELPSLKLGFPPIEDFEVAPDRLLLNFKRISEQFMNTELSVGYYESLIKEIRKITSRSVREYDRNNSLNKYYRIVNSDGKTQSTDIQNIIDALAKKLGDDFQKILDGALSRHYVKRVEMFRDLFAAATWLFGACPKQVIDFTRNEILRAQPETRYPYAAGRCFKETEDFKIIYRAVIEKINYVVNNSLSRVAFPIYWMNALWKIFSLREFAPDVIEEQDAEIILKFTLMNMRDCINNVIPTRRFALKFLQAVRLFVYLLRIRIAHPNFLSPTNERDKQYFESALDFLEKAKNYYQRHGRGRRSQLAGELMNEIVKYMRYEGTGVNIINLLHGVLGEDTGEAE